LAVQAGVDIAVREGFLYNLCVAAEAGFTFRLNAQNHLVATCLPEDVLFGAPPPVVIIALKASLTFI